MHDDASNCGIESTGLHQKKEKKVFASNCVPQPKSADRMSCNGRFLVYIGERLRSKLVGIGGE